MAKRNETLNEPQETTTDNVTDKVTSCPYIALQGDSETYYGYPSKANYCHQVEPARPINLTYQGSVCLEENFNTCPVYLGTWKGSLPPEIRGEASPKKMVSKRFWLWLLLALIGIGLIWVLINPVMRNAIFPPIFATKEQPGFIIPSATYKPTTTPTPSAALAIPTTPTDEAAQFNREATATPSPTSTYSIPTPGPFLKTPFGPYDGFIVHKVASGESVTLLSNMYDTSNEVIIAVNGLEHDYYFFGASTPQPTTDKPYQSPTPTFSDSAAPTKRPTATRRAIPTATKPSDITPTITKTPTPYGTPEIWTTVLIRPGDVLVILPGQKDPENLDRYQAVYTSEVVRVDDIARLYNLTVDELRYINSLGSSDLIPAGRWLVIPYQEAGPPPTPMPTLAATIDFSYAITPPFGPTGEYVLHMVREGENITFIANRYHSRVEVLRAANGLSAIFPGDVLVVLPGMIDPEGIPMFETLLVDKDISVGDLAAQMSVFESDLLWFNSLEEDQIVPAGRWVIYPKPNEEGN